MREKIEALWASHEFGMWLCFIGYVAAASLLWWTPSPGVGVAVMGIAAALMTARKDPSAWEKAAWTFMMFALLLVEILAIRKDRREHDDQMKVLLRQGTEIKAQSESKFKEIGGDITQGVKGILDNSEQQFESITKQQEQEFEATLAKEQISIDSVTGGHSFPMVLINEVGEVLLLVRGGNPIYELTIEIKDNKGNTKTYQPPAPINSGGFYRLGVVSSFALQKQETYREFSITSHARNGEFVQMLAKRLVGKGWVEANLILAGYIPLHRQVIVSQGHSKDYPPDKLESDIMWDTLTKRRKMPHIHVRGDEFDDMGNLKMPPP